MISLFKVKANPPPPPPPKNKSKGIEEQKPESRKVTPPQFYFGQIPEDTRATGNKPQSAIEKVKRNEALSHPKKHVIEHVEEELVKHTAPVQSAPQLTHNKKSVSPTSLSSSAISSLSSPSASSRSSTSSTSSARGTKVDQDEGYRSPSLPKEDEYKVPRPKTVSSHHKSVVAAAAVVHEQSLRQPQMSPSLLKREQTQDELRKAFEAELLAGKSRLKKSMPPPTGGVQVMPGRGGPALPPKPRHEEEEVMGGQVRPPPAPVMPEGRIVTSGRIPEAPKLPKQQVNAVVYSKPKTLPKSSHSAPEMSQREALLHAIRNKGGVNGLRKV